MQFKNKSISSLYKQIIQHKLNVDILWTISSLVILAISGALINIFIVKIKDMAALGVFNLTYTIYIISSQIAVMGIHYSVMRYTALYVDDLEERDVLLATAIVFSLFLGSIFAGIIFFNYQLFAIMFKNNFVVGKSIRYAALGLLLFPANKVIFAYLNGLRLMKCYAMLQSLRYILVMLWVIGVTFYNGSIEFISYGFLFAELVTFCLGMWYIMSNKLLIKFSWQLRWVKEHFFFGIRGLLAGMFIELNSRVDVLLLGMFLSVHLVGIYSFIIMLIDGLYHLLATIRINFNPVLVGALKDNKLNEIKNLLHKARNYIYPLTLIMVLLIILSFWVFAKFLLPNKGLTEGMVALSILLSGITLISAYIPFDNLMLVSGNPGLQTVQHVSTVVGNIVLNLLLVPLLSIEGAAIATASSYILGIVILFVLAKRNFNWNMLSNSLEYL